MSADLAGSVVPLEGYLEFRSGDRTYAVSLSLVREISRVVDITPADAERLTGRLAGVWCSSGALAVRSFRYSGTDTA